MKHTSKTIAALIFRMVGFLIGTAGIILQFTAADAVGGGFMMKHNLAYFTVQTNIFCVLIFGVLIVKSLVSLQKTGRLTLSHVNRSLHLACVYFISITMLGYWLLLAPMTGIPKNPYLFCSTLFVHTLLPLMAIGDHLLFAPHGGLPDRVCFQWLLYPAAYLLSVILLSFVLTEPYYSFLLNGKQVDLLFPYPFMDPQVVGTRGFLLVVVVMAGLFLLAGLLVLRLDRLIGKKYPNP